jgi:hypothetical protein
MRCRPFLILPILFLAATLRSAAQEPPPPPASEPSADSSATKPPAHSRRPVGFLIRGTVFDLQGLSVPGAGLRIRRTGEKKFHWSTNANSRGEFAVRVPPGNQYEVVVESKGFSEAVQPVNAANGLGEESVVIRMEPVAGRKK